MAIVTRRTESLDPRDFAGAGADVAAGGCVDSVAVGAADVGVGEGVGPVATTVACPHADSDAATVIVSAASTLAPIGALIEVRAGTA